MKPSLIIGRQPVRARNRHGFTSPVVKRLPAMEQVKIAAQAALDRRGFNNAPSAFERSMNAR